jgi:hypothetical protein
MATPNIKCNAVVQRIRWMVNIELDNIDGYNSNK